jgi:hypothetical protein
VHRLPPVASRLRPDPVDPGVAPRSVIARLMSEADSAVDMRLAHRNRNDHAWPRPDPVDPGVAPRSVIAGVMSDVDSAVEMRLAHRNRNDHAWPCPDPVDPGVAPSSFIARLMSEADSPVESDWLLQNGGRARKRLASSRT